MIRDLSLLGCAGLLAIGLALSSHAGSQVDTDGDGVIDQEDNCVFVANGPDQSTFSCDAQEDGDLDGYGNPCDTDVDNDGATSINDVLAFFDCFSMVCPVAAFDIDCDGAPSINDAIRALSDSNAVATPGPSGLACASVCAEPGVGCTPPGYPCP